MDLAISPKDLFLSHASEDKEAHVLPLARALDNFAITYWLDTVEIGWGDSIVAKLNEGLTASRYVLVFLTENFLRKGWTKRELDAAFAVEVASERIVLLPVLAAPQETVFQVYPLLRPKKYLRVDLGSDRIAAEVSRLLGREFKSEWVHHHPATYAGEVWVKILKQETALDEPHRISIRWGPWRRDVDLPANPARSVVLVHTKGNDGLSVPIFLDVNPSCFAMFGCGGVPGGSTIDINVGWVRVEA